MKKTGRFLIIIDNKPIRRKALSGCKKILKKYDSIKKQIYRFENEDKLLFTRWLNSKFGSELSKIREIKEENKSNEEFIKLINIIKYSKRISFNHAYVIASELKNNPSGIEDYLGSENDSSSSDENQFSENQEYFSFSETEDRDRIYSNLDDDDDDQYESYDDYDDDELPDEFFLKNLYVDVIRDIPGYEKFLENEELFEKMFADFKKKFSNTEDREQPSMHMDVGSEPNRTSTIKALYRSLVIQLHPDNCETFDCDNAELWYKIQDAYKKGDIEQLEMLNALNQIRKNDFPKDCPVSHILHVHEEYEKQMRMLHRLLKNYKSDVAWDFSRSSENDKEKLSKTIHTELNEILTDEIERQTYLDSVISKWSAPAMQPLSMRKKRGTAFDDPAQQELPFFFDE